MRTKTILTITGMTIATIVIYLRLAQTRFHPVENMKINKEEIKINEEWQYTGLITYNGKLKYYGKVDEGDVVYLDTWRKRLCYFTEDGKICYTIYDKEQYKKFKNRKR